MPSIDLEPLSPFANGRAQRVEANGRGLVIVRHDNAVYALRDTCPHQGARLSDGHLSGHVLSCKPGQDISIERQDEILVCPWHGWEFDITSGRSLIDPQKKRVRSYAAHTENGRVVIDMD